MLGFVGAVTCPGGFSFDVAGAMAGDELLCGACGFATWCGIWSATDLGTDLTATGTAVSVGTDCRPTMTSTASTATATATPDHFQIANDRRGGSFETVAGRFLAMMAVTKSAGAVAPADAIASRKASALATS